MPPDLERVLKSNREAWRNYTALAPGYRKQYSCWWVSAIKPETRETRLREAIRLLERNRKLGMK